jgi:hypothetical protein
MKPGAFNIRFNRFQLAPPNLRKRSELVIVEHLLVPGRCFSPRRSMPFKSINGRGSKRVSMTRREPCARPKGVDQSLINQLESIIIVFIKYQNQSMALDEKNG